MGSLASKVNKKQTKSISFEELAQLLVQYENIVALTGAGISVDSGLPTFRNPNDGIWKKYDPISYATIWGFWKFPEKIWHLLVDTVKAVDPKPNQAHTALAILEQKGYLKSIITQNIDNLHQDAGSKDVIEYHGNIMKAKCTSCSKLLNITKQLLHDIQFTSHLPPKCSCGKYLKPEVVLFGERIPSGPSRQAEKVVKECDLLLVIGTSASVYPAASLPKIASEHGAQIIEINIEETGLTNKYSDFIIKESSSGLIQTSTLLPSKL